MLTVKTTLPRTLQELGPSEARFCLGICRFIERDLGVSLSGAHVLVGFSGGADSTALLLCLRYLAPKMGCSLHAAHLDHALRPSSAEEAARCAAFCDLLGVPRTVIRRDVRALSLAGGKGIEESARIARYEFYESVAAGEQCDWIALGHNKNDLAEDQLMRLIRGTGWPGLGGMRAVDAGRRLLRPLLLSSRDAIEAFLTALGISWIEDESNKSDGYFRNRVRNRLLPLIMEENPAYLEQAAGMWRLARSDEEYFTCFAEESAKSWILTEDGKDEAQPLEILLPRGMLLPLPAALRLRLYKEALARLGCGQVLQENLLALDKSWQALSCGQAMKGRPAHQFPGGKQAQVSKRGILFTSPSS